jgi:hypothetical protein
MDGKADIRFALPLDFSRVADQHSTRDAKAQETKMQGNTPAWHHRP